MMELQFCFDAKCLTILYSAMICSTPTIVDLLLENGANPMAKYKANCAYRLDNASMKGKVENVKFWLERFPDTDMSL